jgi:hypothetical protein
MTNQNLSLCRVRIFVKGSNGNRTSKEQFFEFQNPEKACESLGLTPGNDYQKAYDKLRAYHGNRVQLVHITEIKREQAKQKAKKRKKAKNYAREKFAPIPANGKPMKRLNMDVKEITQKPVESSKNWKKAAEIARKENKQAKAVNNSKQTEKTNAGKVSGMFPESTKVTKAHTAAKRAKLENEYIPSNNSSEYKKYKGKGTKGNKRGTQVGTQTTFL